MIFDIASRPVVLAMYEGKFKDFKRVKDEIRLDFQVNPHPEYLRSAVHCTESGFETTRDLRAWKSYL